MKLVYPKPLLASLLTTVAIGLAGCNNNEPIPIDTNNGALKYQLHQREENNYSQSELQAALNEFITKNTSVLSPKLVKKLQDQANPINKHITTRDIDKSKVFREEFLPLYSTVKNLQYLQDRGSSYDPKFLDKAFSLLEQELLTTDQAVTDLSLTSYWLSYFLNLELISPQEAYDQLEPLSKLEEEQAFVDFAMDMIHKAETTEGLLDPNNARILKDAHPQVETREQAIRLLEEFRTLIEKPPEKLSLGSAIAEYFPQAQDFSIAEQGQLINHLNQIEDLVEAINFRRRANELIAKISSLLPEERAPFIHDLLNSPLSHTSNLVQTD